MTKSFAEIAAETQLPVAELQRHARELEAQFATAGDPLPGPLADAFPARLKTVAGLVIRPIVASDFMVLRQLDSPTIRQMREAAKPVETRQKIEATDEEGWELILQFTRPSRAIAELMARGRAAFRAAAIAEIGDRLNPLIAFKLVKSIDEMIGESFKTALRYCGDEDDFPAPPPPLRTASAGGSTTAPSSKSNADSPAPKS